MSALPIRLSVACFGLLIAAGCSDRSQTAARSETAERRSVAPRTVIAAAPLSGRFRLLEGDSSHQWQVKGIALTRNRLFIQDAGLRDSVFVFALDSALTPLLSITARVNAASAGTTTLLPASDSTVMLVSKQRRTATEVDERGRTASQWEWTEQSDAIAFCAESDSSAVLVQHIRKGYRMRRLYRKGNFGREWDVAEPWPGYYQRHWLAGHLTTAPTPSIGGCVLAHRFDLGFALVGPTGTTVNLPYIESLPPATVAVETSTVNGVFSSNESAAGAVRSTREIAVSGDSVLTLFEGRERGAAARLDVYDLTQRRYRHTLNLNQRIEALASSSRAVAIVIRRNERLGVWVGELHGVPSATPAPPTPH